MNDHVRTELERSLVVGGEEGVVRHVKQVVVLADRGDGSKVRDLQGRVCRCLGEDQLGVLLDCVLDPRGVRRVGKGDIHSELGQELICKTVGAAVDDVSHNDMVASLEKTKKYGDRCGHSGCVGRRVIPTF